MAQAMFGRGGRALIPVLHDGAGGLRTLRQEFEDLGGGITQEALDASRQYGAENRRLNASFGQLRSTIAVALLPAFTWFVHVQVRLARGFNDLTKGTHVVQIALAILASVAALAALKVLVTWFPVIAPFLAWAAVIAGVILVIDDLITMVEGGDSEIGHLIDTIWGVGTTKEVVAGLKLWWEDFRDSARMLAHDFEDYWLRAINAVSRAFAAVIDPLAARFEGVRRLLGTDVAHNVAHQESLAEFRARMVRLRAQQPLAASGTTQAATAGMVGPENQQAVARTATVPAPVRVQVAVPAAARAPVQHTSHRTLNAPITIHGGTASPQEIATHVRRELAERETAAADANHPSPEGD